MTRALGTFAAMLVVIIACASVIGLAGVLMRGSREVGRRAGYTAAVDSVRAAQQRKLVFPDSLYVPYISFRMTAFGMRYVCTADTLTEGGR